MVLGHHAISITVLLILLGSYGVVAQRGKPTTASPTTVPPPPATTTAPPTTTATPAPIPLCPEPNRTRCIYLYEYILDECNGENGTCMWQYWIAGCPGNFTCMRQVCSCQMCNASLSADPTVLSVLAEYNLMCADPRCWREPVCYLYPENHKRSSRQLPPLVEHLQKIHKKM